MTHQSAYLVLPELTPAAIRAGAARAAETPDEALAVALTLLVSNALGDHPDEQAIRDAWHDGRPFEGASDTGLPGAHKCPRCRAGNHCQGATVNCDCPCTGAAVTPEWWRP